MTHYQQKRRDGLTEAEYQEQCRAWNLALGIPSGPSPLNPSGLVPYPCDHGIAVKPARFAATRQDPWLDEDGNEKPPYGGKSWGRSKYLAVTSFGGRDGVPYAIAECVVCVTGVIPDDFYTAADGTTLR